MWPASECIDGGGSVIESADEGLLALLYQNALSVPMGVITEASWSSCKSTEERVTWSGIHQKNKTFLSQLYATDLPLNLPSVPPTALGKLSNIHSLTKTWTIFQLSLQQLWLPLVHNSSRQLCLNWPPATPHSQISRLCTVQEWSSQSRRNVLHTVKCYAASNRHPVQLTYVVLIKHRDWLDSASQLL